MTHSSTETDPKDLDAVFATCPSGPMVGARRKQFEAALVGVDDPLPKSALKIWMTDFLIRELPHLEAGVWLWAGSIDKPSKYSSPDTVLNRLIRSIREDRQPSPLLTVAGGRHVGTTWAGANFDLVEGVETDANPIDQFEIRLFNLKLLYRSCVERKSQWTDKRPGFGGTQKVRPSAS